MDNCSQEISMLFEVSWEVCNKIGGIYAVLSSKAKTLKETLKDNLVFIGPDVWSNENPSPYFTESETLMHSLMKRTMLPDGVFVRVGRWEIPGRPVAILVKFQGMDASKDAAYGRMWDLFGVDSLHAYGDYDEGCNFARAAAAVIEGIVKAAKVSPRQVVAHFDEWTTAMGLLTLKADMPEIATVFTTHATSIGRSICGNGKPLYDYLSGYNGNQMASELNMQSKHSLESAAARNADCFTTVSDVTATECAQLLGKKPDVVTPNGFELNFVPAKTKYTKARTEARSRLLEVANALTGSDFDDDTLVIATSGRCEYRNKGIDVFIDSLDRLRHKQHSRRVLAFVLVPAWCGGPREDLQHNMETGSVQRLSDPVLTHKLNNYNEDPINNRIHQLNFCNDNNSGVGVIYVPCYLDGHDGIFDKTYYELLPGLDATVFPSYYEPWGYTPLESIAFGVPTVTTTLAGFGKWILSECEKGLNKCGVAVVERTDSNYDSAVSTISEILSDISETPKRKYSAMRKAAMKISEKAQWSDFIKYYNEAYCIAIKNRDARMIK